MNLKLKLCWGWVALAFLGTVSAEKAAEIQIEEFTPQELNGLDEGNLGETKGTPRYNKLKVNNLRAYNEQVDSNLTVGGTLTANVLEANSLNVSHLTITGTEYIDSGLVVAGNANIEGTLNVAGLLGLTSPNVLDAGVWYSNASDTAYTAVTMSPFAGNTLTFTPVNNSNGTGVTVNEAGLYLVWAFGTTAFTASGITLSLYSDIGGTVTPLTATGMIGPYFGASLYWMGNIAAGTEILLSANEPTASYGGINATVMLGFLRVR